MILNLEEKIIGLDGFGLKIKKTDNYKMKKF